MRRPSTTGKDHMRIWHVCAPPRPGDPDDERSAAVHHLAAAQAAQGDEVRVLDASEARTIATTERPEVIHLHARFHGPLVGLWPLLRRTPYVISLHGSTDPARLTARGRWRARWTSLADQRLVGGAAALIVRSTAERREAYRTFADAPVVRIVPDAIDAALLDAERPTTVGTGPVRTWLGWELGGDRGRSGLEDVAAIARRMPQETFAVHGRPTADPTPPRATADLRFDGPLERSSRVHVLRETKAFLLLSPQAGQGSVLAEVMALGIACLVSSEVAATLGTAAPVIRLPEEPRQAAELAARALEDPAWLDATGRAGRRWVRERCAPSVVAARTATIYDEAIALPALGLAPLPRAATTAG